jgi:hypothetical protein
MGPIFALLEEKHNLHFSFRFYMFEAFFFFELRHRICLQTDGHGETSIPPYNFVAGDINIWSKSNNGAVWYDRSKVAMAFSCTSFTASLIQKPKLIQEICWNTTWSHQIQRKKMLQTCKKRGGSLSFLTIFTFAVPELLDLIWRKIGFVPYVVW